jgi:hypothetical protein
VILLAFAFGSLAELHTTEVLGRDLVVNPGATRWPLYRTHDELILSCSARSARTTPSRWRSEMA